MSEIEQVKRLWNAMSEDTYSHLLDTLTDKVGDLDDRYIHITNRIDQHVDGENTFRKEITDRLKAGDERMKNIEAEITALNRLVDAFEGFQKTIKVASIFAGACLALMLYIFNEKNSDIKATQDTLIKHSIALERLVTSHTELEKDFRREMDHKK